jgi:hypothetical protein
MLGNQAVAGISEGCGQPPWPGAAWVTFSGMASSVHELPEEIVLTREEYRLQHAALEAALDVLDRQPTADADGRIRAQIENALQMLLRRIWPYLDELHEQD